MVEIRETYGRNWVLVIFNSFNKVFILNRIVKNYIFGNTSIDHMIQFVIIEFVIDLAHFNWLIFYP